MPSGSAAARHWPPDVAGRTYLQRIAQPLRPGDPVLFAMPQVAPDDARPPATPPVVSAAPASGPVLRRTPSRVASPAPMQAPSPRSAMSPAPADAAAPPPAMSAHGPDTPLRRRCRRRSLPGSRVRALALDPPAMQAPLAAAPAPMDVARGLAGRADDDRSSCAHCTRADGCRHRSRLLRHGGGCDRSASVARTARRCAVAGPRVTACSAAPWCNAAR